VAAKNFSGGWYKTKLWLVSGKSSEGDSVMIRYPYIGRGYENYEKKVGDFPRQFLRDLFYKMLRIRRLEEAVEADYHKDEMKTPIHLVIGQEACAVGAAAALRNQDLVYTGHRTHGIYLAKGGSLEAMLAEFFCRSTGCVGSRGGSMHLVDKSVGLQGGSAIVGGAIPITAGAALASQILKKDYVSLVFLGDAATEEGACSESLNFAALKKLPMIFFCENNFYSVQTPLTKRQPENVEIWKRSGAFGLESVLVDGNNVLEVYEVTKLAWERARKGDGPTFIEARTYRQRAHGGSGDDSKTGYRDVTEGESWKPFDPVEMYYDFLSKTNVITPADRDKMEKTISTEIQQAFVVASSAANPTKEDLNKYVYMD
jgi:acetoin:2,6-dichlorophenolindophenol oxidoreductase subunit alpha